MRLLLHRRTYSLMTAAVLVAAALVAGAGPADAASRARPGRYVGTTVEAGTPVAAEWVRFRVRRTKVVGFTSRVWVHCYVYPNSYYQLPLVFRMPTAKIRRNKVDRAWTQRIRVEGETEELKGRVQLRFKRGRTVTGRLSVEVANCATRLGDPPYWLGLRVKRKR